MTINLDDTTMFRMQGFLTLRYELWEIFDPPNAIEYRSQLGQTHNRLEDLIIGCRVLHRTEVRKEFLEEHITQ